MTIGGKIGSGFGGGPAILEVSGGIFLEGDRPLPVKVALGDGVWRSPKPLKELRDPDNLFEKLLLRLCDAEPLLEAVD